MEQISLAEFIDGYAEGYIVDVVVVKDRIYGKDPRGMADEDARYKVVWAEIP